MAKPNIGTQAARAIGRGGSGFVLGTIFNTVDALNTIRIRRKENPNESMTRAVAAGAVSWGVRQALWGVASPLMFAHSFGQLGTTLGEVAYTAYRQGPTARNYNPNFGGRYQDTEVAATMRQRGVAAIQNSRMNARSVLGSEARSLHFGRPR